MRKMKAAVLYGPNDLRIEEYPTPSIGPHEVLCRVRACAICGSDLHILTGKWQKASYPLIFGHEWTGEVVEVGEGVDEFHVGDRVAVEPHKGCGYCINCAKGLYTICLNYGNVRKGHKHIGFTVNGGFAEFCAAPVNFLHHLPDALSYENGTLVTTAGTSLYALERARVGAGDFVVIIGPGPVGLLAGAFSKVLGAETVVSIGTRDERLNIARKLGADEVINIHKEDPVEKVRELSGGIGADVVIETAGTPLAIQFSVEMVRPGGRIAWVGNTGGKKTEIPTDKIMLGNIDIFGVRAEGQRACERAIKILSSRKIEIGELITHVFPLDQIHRALEVYAKRMEGAIKVVVKI